MHASTVPTHPANPAPAQEAVIELSPLDLRVVAGGLNPQPLPPRHIRD